MFVVVLGSTNEIQFCSVNKQKKIQHILKIMPKFVFTQVTETYI